MNNFFFLHDFSRCVDLPRPWDFFSSGIIAAVLFLSKSVFGLYEGRVLSSESEG